ncbi:MAG TPA: CocE/NonD family hydrolase [Stellaceae bacterium]|nr:CocE/NonD family hydrolase [Stellaceae bacterium]
MIEERSETRHNMRITWDMAIPMDDGIVLRCDVFRPVAEGRYPVIMTQGAYGKSLDFRELHRHAWERMAAEHPDTMAGSTNSYPNWEVVDPEKWVPDGYVVIRVDARGSGRSPGYLNPWSPREIRDYHDCIEWAARQPWSNGKIGLNGISYYARTQWYVAALQPPHLAAICVWEGAYDCYRDITRHGGIVSDFMLSMFPRQIMNVQHGVGERGPKSRWDGELVAGPETLSDAELAKNRADMAQWIVDHALDDQVHRERTPDMDKITVPLLSAGNWGGHGLHLRGNIDGFVRAASTRKWLEVHGDTHWTHFYTDYGVAMQKRFFGHFLKGEKTGWENQPPVLLQVRHLDRFVERPEREWPLARTRWTRFHLDPATRELTREAPRGEARLEYEAMGNGLAFVTPPFEAETEITGPVALTLTVSSSTNDADFFPTLRLFAPDGQEVVFQGASDPRAALAYGWLRASHRKLDPKLSLPYHPYHTHDEAQPLRAGEPVEVQIEIWPTSIVVPKGYRIGLTIQGRDCDPEDPPTRIGSVDYKPRATVGPFRHNHPKDRPPAIFGGSNALHFGGARQNCLLLPIIPG